MSEEKTTLLEKEDTLQEEAQDKTELTQTPSESSPDNDKNTETQPVKIYQEKNPRSKLLFIVIGILAVVLLVMAYFLFFKGKPEGAESGHIRQMQHMAEEVQGMESQVKQKQDEILNLMGEYKEKTGGETMGVNPLNLTPEEKELLEKKISEEKDVSVKSLLEEILDKNNEIKNLEQRIKEIEALLPKPHIVQKGEIHYKIAMNFLINEKNVEQKRASELVERAALLDTLVPGFKVWNFYSGDEYGTSVTQGTADVSPNTLIRKAKKELVDAKDKAISERDTLAEEVKALEAKREKIINQLDILNKEKANLINKVGELNSENLVMQQTINSLFYILDTRKSLEKKDVIKGSGLFSSSKLKNVAPELYTRSVDLRSTNQILFTAADVGLEKIKDVYFYPNFYKEKKDFTIAIAPDKQSATITLLSTQKFKNERVVIAVK